MTKIRVGLYNVKSLCSVKSKEIIILKPFDDITLSDIREKIGKDEEIIGWAEMEE